MERRVYLKLQLCGRLPFMILTISTSNTYMYVNYSDSFIGLFDCGEEYHFIVGKDYYNAFVG